MYIAVDFDGTCVEHMYPDMGNDIEGAVEGILLLQENGHKIILHTMRSNDELDQAVEWFTVNKISLFGINHNPDQPAYLSNKIYADLYIDDSAVGCPIRNIGSGRPIVDWSLLLEKLKERKAL